MGQGKDTADESIGRPEPWGEGRYEKKGQSVEESVLTPPGTVANADKRPSAPVTLKDYESPETASSQPKDRNQLPGGDAG
jgi:hypothetical protein